MPDSSRWWGGESDLSAVGWLACDDQKAYLVVRVKDDRHIAAKDAGGMAQSDSLRVGLARHGKDDLHEYTIGLVGDTVTVVKDADAIGEQDGHEVEARVERIDARGETVYRVALDRSLVGADTFFMNFAVNDNDSDYAKQAIEWRPDMVENKEPAHWYRAAMPE